VTETSGVSFDMSLPPLRPLESAAGRGHPAIARARNREPLWPTLEQELLLRAALESGQPMLDAWTAWRTAFDYERLDDGTRRLVPLLHANLTRHGVCDDVLTRMGQVHRLSWFRSQQLMLRLKRALASFSAAGIETVLLKGLPLALAYYDDADLRPIGDIDVMIRHRDWRAATKILTETGWHLDHSWEDEDPLQRGTHAVAFRDPHGVEFDLHHSPFHECLEPAKLAPFWDRAVPLVRPGIASRMLCPADQLLHCLTHGLRANEVATVRWVADAVTILRREPGLDWPLLLDQTRKLRLGRPVSTGLRYLASTFPGLVPESVLAELARYKPGLVERIEWYARGHEAVAGQGSRFGYFFRLYEGKPLIVKLAHMPSYLADIFWTNSGRQTVVALARKSAKALRGLF